MPVGTSTSSGLKGTGTFGASPLFAQDFGPHLLLSWIPTFAETTTLDVCLRIVDLTIPSPRDRSGHFIFPILTSKVTILKKSSTVQKFKVQGINPAGHMRPPVQKFKDQPYGSKFKAFGRSIVQKVQPLDFPLRSAAFRKARRILLRCLGSKSLP